MVDQFMISTKIVNNKDVFLYSYPINNTANDLTPNPYHYVIPIQRVKIARSTAFSMLPIAGYYTNVTNANIFVGMNTGGNMYDSLLLELNAGYQLNLGFNMALSNFELSEIDMDMTFLYAGND